MPSKSWVEARRSYKTSMSASQSKARPSGWPVRGNLRLVYISLMRVWRSVFISLVSDLSAISVVATAAAVDSEKTEDLLRRGRSCPSQLLAGTVRLTI